MSTYNFQTVYKDFALSSEEILVDRNKALRILLSKKKRKVYFAESIDDNIHISNRYITCPYCGKRIPAYEKWDYERSLKLKEKTLSLCDIQMMLFPSNRTRYILFNNALAEGEKVLCPHCNSNGVISNEKISYIITTEQNLLKVSRKLSGIFDISNMRWLPNVTLSFDGDECIETVCFDMKSGELHVFLECAGRILATTRVYSSITLGSQDPWLKMLDNKRIFREVRRAFSSCYGEIPFSSKELDFDKLILLTKYVGYSSEFFNELPFNINTGDKLLCEDFDDIGRKLRFSADVPTVLSNTVLPQIKSIKRCIYRRPSLLFYTTELTRLWKIVENADLFCSLLKCRYIFVIISLLHQYWNVDEFLTAIRKKEGAVWLCNYLKSATGYRLILLGFKYYYLNDRMRRVMLEKVSTSEYYIMTIYVDEYIDYSIPMPLPKERTGRQRVNNYYFVCLDSTKALIDVSRVLNNCLYNYTSFFNSIVFSVAKGKKIIAAIEVKNNFILQAHSKDNGQIMYHLRSAIKRWAKINGYSFDKYSF